MNPKYTHPLFKISLLSLAVASSMAYAQGDVVEEEIVVTGYKGSLQNAANAKRESTALVESVFSEDIGKFADSNIAEAMNRMPGVQINRDPFGQGVNVSVRGLGTSFTKVLLNGSQFSVATSGTIDSQNQNREVDLDLFPTELFSRFDIQKTPTAGALEGGVSGIINIRAARPFDFDEGVHTNVKVEDTFTELEKTHSPNLVALSSWHNDTFGVLGGLSYSDRQLVASGYETIGYSNLDISNRLCDPATTLTADATSAACNPSGSNNWNVAGMIRTAGNPNRGLGVVPNNAGAGLTSGAIIDQAFLLAQNPGLNMTQIGEALMPRLGRFANMDGNNERTTGLVSFEFRPSEEAEFYLDALASQEDMEVTRLAMTLVGRSGAMIPTKMVLDQNNVVQSGTFGNVRFHQEARYYMEESSFYNINPGARFLFGDNHKLDVQFNKGESSWDREAPTVMVATPLNQGIFLNYTNGDVPTFDVRNASGAVSLNDTSLGWGWDGGRLNIQNEKRDSETEGAHVDYRFGDDDNNIKFGLAYDSYWRHIRGFDNSAVYEDMVCRNGLDVDGNSPHSSVRAGCTGLNANSLITPTELSSYIIPGPGFISVDLKRFFADTPYAELSANAPEGGGSSTGASTAIIDEETTGGYFELNTKTEIAGKETRINLGARYIETEQVISGPVTLVPFVARNGANPPVAAVRQYFSSPTDYNMLLPSMNISFMATDDLVLRLAASRTMTRPNPSQMLPATGFSDPAAQNATYGNTGLAPYLSSNIDFGGEWYTGDEGYVGATFFGKQMTGFTVTQTSNIPFNQLLVAQGNTQTFTVNNLSTQQQTALAARGGVTSPILVSQISNAPGNLEIEGAEFTWVQPLDMILNGLGFNANYTHIYQRGEGQGAPAKALGVAPNTYNFTTYWEDFGASVRLSYVWYDDMTSSGPNQNGVLGAELKTDARGQLDLSASYDFEDVFGEPQISLNINNLTDEPLRMTFAHDSATFSYFKVGIIATLGVKASF